MQFNQVALTIGLAFGPLAALSAYLITYSEYQHHYPDKKTPRKVALETGIGTLIFFPVLSLIIDLFLGNMFR